MRKLVLTILVTFGLVFSLAAQNRTITGQVTDENGKPIPNASVIIKGTKTGTSTTANGSFSISVPPKAKLVISSVNMDAQEVTVGSSSNLEISLKLLQTSLQEVVVSTGYGTTRKKRDEASAISTVGAREIENKPNVSLDKALQGKAAGVFVQSNNGIPGGAINVRIRGAGSINAGNAPLYIVDGIQLNVRDDAGFTQSNPLAFLNPDDIQSIDILKDAASAAIYGSNAANGVVLVTTKKGRAGKTKFTFNTYFGTATPFKKFDVVNAQEFFQARVEATANNSNLPSSNLGIRQQILQFYRIPGATGFNATQIDSAVATLPTFDWQGAAFRNGNIKNYEISASGGNEKTTFRISANLSDQTTIISKADFKRQGLKVDLTNKATERLTINTNLNLSTFLQNVPFAVSGSFLGSPAFGAAAVLGVNPIYNKDGSFYGLPSGTPSSLIGASNQNIIAVNDYNSGYQRTNQFVGSISPKYKINDWLSANLFAGLDYRLVQGKRYTDPRTTDGFQVGGSGTVQSNWNTNINTYATLNFAKTYKDKHTIDALAGYEYRQENNESITGNATGFPTFQFTSLQNAATPVTVSEFFTGFRRNAVFANLNYNYDSKYLIGIVGRYDGSSRFGSGNRYGTFGGIKAAWNIDQEKFMDNIANAVSTLRLRVSYGSVGNDQIGNFDGLGLFGGGGIYSGSAGIAYTQLANPNLKWETSKTANLGLDFGFVQNRINGSVEVYDKRNSDLLLNLPLQSSTGFTSIASNVGATQNKGVELTLNLVPIKAKVKDDFEWNLNFVFAYNKQIVTKLYDNLQVLPGDPSIRVGEPVNVLFASQYAGVNASTGRAFFYDSLGNIVYQLQNRDAKVIGPRNLSPYNGGLTNTFTYKGFTLDASFNYEYGRYSTDGQVNFLRESRTLLNILQESYNKRWTAPGQVTEVPRFNTAAELRSSNQGAGTRPFFKADYIRLRNVTLAYEFPSKMLSRAKLTNARVYIQATNLLTISDWYSYDIEFVGDATGIIPQSKNVTFGVQLGF